MSKRISDNRLAEIIELSPNRDFMSDTNSVTPKDLKDLREGPYAICVFNEDDSCEVAPQYSLETLIERIAELEATVKRLAGELNRENKP